MYEPPRGGRRSCCRRARKRASFKSASMRFPDSMSPVRNRANVWILVPFDGHGDFDTCPQYFAKKEQIRQ